VCLQPLNEVLNGREVLGLQGVVTDVDGNYHGFKAGTTKWSGQRSQW
jgi:hypothetical protein